MTSASSNDRPPLALAWLRLFRIPNVFTALADVMMGFAVVHQGLQPWQPLVVLLLASACLYTAGMVLNDVFDVAQDTRERPQRPIPSGQIPLGLARLIGFALLLIGVIAGGAAGYMPQASAAYPWRSGAIAVAIAVSVLLYDMVLKRTLVAPVFMGLCRFFNVLLGVSAADVQSVAERSTTAYFDNGQLLVAGAMGVYVLGITIFARTEASKSQQSILTQALAIMGFGIAMLLLVPKYLVSAQQINEGWIWPALLLMLGLSIGRHCIYAIMDPQPMKVQNAVKFAILSVITLDAAVTLYVAGPTHALIVFALVVPAMALGRIVYST